jgi:hypothetical protein
VSSSGQEREELVAQEGTAGLFGDDVDGWFVQGEEMRLDLRKRVVPPGRESRSVDEMSQPLFERLPC